MKRLFILVTFSIIFTGCNLGSDSNLNLNPRIYSPYKRFTLLQEKLLDRLGINLKVRHDNYTHEYHEKIERLFESIADKFPEGIDGKRKRITLSFKPHSQNYTSMDVSGLVGNNEVDGDVVLLDNYHIDIFVRRKNYNISPIELYDLIGRAERHARHARIINRIMMENLDYPMSRISSTDILNTKSEHPRDIDIGADRYSFSQNSWEGRTVGESFPAALDPDKILSYLKRVEKTLTNETLVQRIKSEPAVKGVGFGSYKDGPVIQINSTDRLFLNLYFDDAKLTDEVTREIGQD